MLSINTNLSSLIAQNSLKNSTSILNQAVERMTTGYKINHASDNAANYSISTNMQTQISSYDIAADNVAMGMDLVTTASDIISSMQDHTNRLQSLSIQARNGTYGTQSMAAINSEAAAIMAEINRLYSTAEYNNISLFNRKAYEIDPSLPQAGASGFIEEPVTTYSLRGGSGSSADYGDFISNPKTYTDEDIALMKTITQAIDEGSLEAYGEYSISTKDELVALAEYVNAGSDTTDMTFVLGADIDLASISNWTPIGYYNDDWDYCFFEGTFDGNSHVIKNLTINNPTRDYQGLFSAAETGTEIKNVALEDVNIKGNNYIGGLVGFNYGDISNSYATGNVTGNYCVGGLAGRGQSISNSYATGNVTGNDHVGGLVGSNFGDISNSYATGNVTGNDYVGGLVGQGYQAEISNSYATGNVTGNGYVGGLAGTFLTISHSYATGNVTGNNYVGGLAGDAGSVGNIVINNSYATGNVNGYENVGGIVGLSYEGDDSHLEIIDCYATGNIVGHRFVGGIIGSTDTYLDPMDDLLIENCASYSQIISGNESVGSILGGWIGEEENGYYTSGSIRIENCTSVSSQPALGAYYTYNEDTGDTNIDLTKDLSTYNAGTISIPLTPVSTTLLVGINGDSSCQIGFDTNFDFDLSAIGSDISSDSALACINDFLTLLSEKSTMLGAVQNRLESALESITVNMENLTSSLSTIRDADIAEVSSEYIRQQILQQASATLMATANQSPSIALQLI